MVNKAILRYLFAIIYETSFEIIIYGIFILDNLVTCDIAIIRLVQSRSYAVIRRDFKVYGLHVYCKLNILWSARL